MRKYIQQRLKKIKEDSKNWGNALALKKNNVYRLIFECSPDAIFLLDSDLIIDINPQALELFGCSREELIGKNLLHLSQALDLQGNKQKIQLSIQGEPQIIAWRHIRSDGRQFDVEAVVSRIELNKQGFLQAVIRDVTWRRENVEKVNQRTRELEALARISAAMRVAKTLVEIYPVILQQLTDTMRAKGAAIFVYNPTVGVFETALGWSDWKKNNDWYLPSFQEITERVIATREAFYSDGTGGDIELQTPADLAHLACIPMVASEQPIGVLWIGRDFPFFEDDIRLLSAIADMAANAVHRQTLHDNLQIQLENLQQTQARLLQSEKLAAIGQLASGVAHELNNPLTSVILYSQLVQQEIHDPHVAQNITKVVSEAIRAGRIVRGMLDFARLHPGKRENIQVNTVLVDSLDLVSYELVSRNIKVDLALSPELPIIIADVNQLQQVFLNLFQNAWQAIDKTGVEGRLGVITESGLSHGNSPSPLEGRVVRIIIKDNGEGITKDKLNKIFDPFFTTKPEGEGTGLGLSICRGIITDHGGQVWAESSRGEGTTLTMELPITQFNKPGSEENTPLKSPLISKSDVSILIIDDEPNVQNVLARALQKKGYRVKAVDTGIEGLSLVEKDKYSHILCDIHMPDLNGIEFYKRLKAMDSSSAGRLILITGDITNSATQSFINKNKLQYLSKPFELNDLYKIFSVQEREEGNP